MSQSETGSVSQGRAEFPMGAAKDVDERPPAPEIDITKPHVARMYDYYLGGKHNYAADREAAEQVIKLIPQARIGARVNRRFLIESVRWLAREAGVRQFLDIGSGLPTQQNVHEVAQSVDKDAKVVYVDNDPLVRVHAETLLATDPNTIVIEADLRDPKALLDRPELREHLDFTQPIGLLLVAVLHFIEDTQEAYEIARTLYDGLPSGSYVVMSHGLTDRDPNSATEQTRKVYQRASSGVFPRTSEEIAGFFAGLTPVGCGLTHIADWTVPGGSGGGGGEGGDGDVVTLGDPAALRKLPGMCGIARIDR